MSKKIVLITGASRGIGGETAKRFARSGFVVAINYKTNHKAAVAVLDEIQQSGGAGFLCQADIADEQQVKQLFEQIDQQNGDLSVLVNNAAIIQPQSLLQNMDAERINHLLRTNVTSAFLCCKEAIKRMSSSLGGKGGAIVNVSSLAARTGSPNEYIDYAASKGAIDSLTVGLAKEIASENIRVNAVRPGLIYTDIHASAGEANRVKRLEQNIPLQRGGLAEEVAEAIYWLSSDKSSFCTGSLLDVGGGL